jgi:hypothetical protein
MRTRLSGLTVTPTPPTSCRQAYAIGWSEIEAQSYFERVGPSVWCSTCDCSVTATCGGTVELFSDSQCTANESDVPADSQCHPAPAGIGVVNSYRYVASAATNVGGAPLGLPITETLWTDTVTVCCPP